MVKLTFDHNFLLQRLYASGARKFFLAGTGALGCIPAERVKNKTHECNEERNFWSVKYNEVLKAMLSGLKSELQGINYSYFDTYSIMQNLIQKPSAYGKLINMHMLFFLIFFDSFD